MHLIPLKKARGSGDLEVVVLRDKISSLLQVLKEYEVESSAGDAKIKELSEKHKSQRAKMKPGENNLEEEFRMKSEECLVIQEKVILLHHAYLIDRTFRFVLSSLFYSLERKKHFGHR